QAPPGVQALPGVQTPPGVQALPGVQAPPGVQALPGVQTPPGEQARPGVQASPDEKTAPAAGAQVHDPLFFSPLTPSVSPVTQQTVEATALTNPPSFPSPFPTSLPSSSPSPPLPLPSSLPSPSLASLPLSSASLSPGSFSASSVRAGKVHAEADTSLGSEGSSRRLSELSEVREQDLLELHLPEGEAPPVPVLGPSSVSSASSLAAAEREDKNSDKRGENEREEHRESEGRLPHSELEPRVKAEKTGDASSVGRGAPREAVNDRKTILTDAERVSSSQLDERTRAFFAQTRGDMQRETESETQSEEEREKKRAKEEFFLASAEEAVRHTQEEEEAKLLAQQEDERLALLERQRARQEKKEEERWMELYRLLFFMFAVGFCIASPDSILGATAAQDLVERGSIAPGPSSDKALAVVAAFINGMGAVGALLQGVCTATVTEQFGWDALFGLLCVLSMASSLLLLPACLEESRSQCALSRPSTSADCSVSCRFWRGRHREEFSGGRKVSKADRQTRLCQDEDRKREGGQKHRSSRDVRLDEGSPVRMRTEREAAGREIV
ncbi:zinc finger protein 36 family 3 protein, partial [Toxoplasma gondii FOU]